MKHGPKNETAWRSHFWDRMHRLVKKQKKSSFTVSLHLPTSFPEQILTASRFKLILLINKRLTEKIIN